MTVDDVSTVCYNLRYFTYNNESGQSIKIFRNGKTGNVVTVVTWETSQSCD